MAATTNRTEELELFQLQADEGPCLECYATGQPVSIAELAAERERWPHFVDAALEAGFASVHAVPMRAAGSVLGALGLFGTGEGELNEADRLVARTLAHVASVAIVQERAPTSEVVLPHLRSALAGRTVVEQAKGFVRQRLGVSVADAFALLRRYAHASGTHLTEVARQLLTEPDARPAIMAGVGELAGDRGRHGSD